MAVSVPESILSSFALHSSRCLSCNPVSRSTRSVSVLVIQSSYSPIVPTYRPIGFTGAGAVRRETLGSLDGGTRKVRDENPALNDS
ncbi:hypothetical protein DAEQUDRAFT_727521 [Daedalea quercina L-15889]|uniref:Uncharacterized protein n=1 Tax=Daedalea quercina L-15889 TaxID=1314783 RepID=A0A165PUX4_9APHY|nr:hypothetical protein DAEQUDRAFT_727521 [Daedalea quercina L-15889]